MMRRAVLAAPGEIRLEDDVRLPKPGPREIRVRAQSVGICGSDLHALAGLTPSSPCPSCPDTKPQRPVQLWDHLLVVGCTTSGALADAFVAPAERFVAFRTR